MGNKLIINGASFLGNALELGVDYTEITSLFTGWQTGAWSNGGSATASTSTVFVRTIAVDVSEYAGRKVKVTFVAYTSGGGSSSGYGIVFKDAESGLISAKSFPKNGNVPSSGRTYWEEFTIPATAKYMCVTYLNDTKIAEFGGMKFGAFVENAEPEESE